MAISPAKKASNARWDKDNMTTLGCRVKREDAEKYHAAAKSQGTTINAVLKEALKDLLINASKEDVK